MPLPFADINIDLDKLEHRKGSKDRNTNSNAIIVERSSKRFRIDGEVLEVVFRMKQGSPGGCKNVTPKKKILYMAAIY